MVELVECIYRVGKSIEGGHFKSNFQQVEVHVNFERQKVKVKGVDYVCIFFFFYN